MQMGRVAELLLRQESEESDHGSDSSLSWLVEGSHKIYA